MGSMESWNHFVPIVTKCDLFRYAMKKRPHSWLVLTRNSPASWEFVWRPPVLEAFIFSMDFTMPKLDGQPVLAITGLQFHDLISTYTQQDVVLDKLFMDVSIFNERVVGPTHVENLTDLACRTVFAYRGVAHLTIPVDVQEEEVKKRERSRRNVPHHTSDIYARSARLPARMELEKAAGVLNQGKKVVILAGRGALRKRRKFSVPPSSKLCWARQPYPMTARIPPGSSVCWVLALPKSDGKVTPC